MTTRTDNPSPSAETEISGGAPSFNTAGSEPKSRPILFSAPMVRAILDGRKTQTRRVVKPQPCDFTPSPSKHPERHAGPYIDSYCNAPKTPINPRGMSELWTWWTADDRQGPEIGRCPYGAPGDRLWLREAWQLHERFTDVARVVYRASEGRGWTEMHEDFPAALAHGMDAQPFQLGWRPSIHMPRWASRITLEIAEVRVERLQDISSADAIAEGIYWSHGFEGYTSGAGPDESCDFHTTRPALAYGALWDRINGEGSWAADPWVWAVSFRRVEHPHQPSEGGRRDTSGESQ